MRVLFITGEFPPMQGGVGDCTNEIALALAKRGVEVAVLTTEDEGRTTNDERPRTSDHTTSSIQVMPIVKKWNWSALSQIRQAIIQTGVDIFHIQYQTGAFGMHPMVNFAPRLLSPTFPVSSSTGASGGRRVKSVVTFHDLRPIYLFPQAGRLRDWVTYELARHGDAVIATNEQDYLTLETLSLKLLALIPIGSNIDPTPPPDFDRDVLRARLGVKPDEILLCYFGFLNDSKGGETLIRALAELPNARLLMLGGQTGASDATNLEYLARVLKTIEDLRLAPRVIWTDFMPQAQVTAHFLAADISVLPYRDGASYRRGTFMAALAHGMAIVTTANSHANGGMSDRSTGLVDDSSVNLQSSIFNLHSTSLPPLRDGENVLLIPPDDPPAIADAVRRIAASPELRARLQQGARATAQFFTWDKIAGAHLELYGQLLGA